MLLVKSNQTRDIPSVFSHLWDFIEDYTPAVRTKVPLVNVMDNENEYVLKVLAPKMDAQDLKIEIEDNILHLSISKEQKSETETYSRREYQFFHTERSFELPENADSDNITAKNEDGEIVIRIPKKEITKPSRRQISIE